MARDESGRPHGDDEAADRARTTERTPLTQQLGRVLVALLAVLFAVFALANSQFVDFSWVFGSTQVQAGQDGERVAGGVPLIVLMVASLAIGLLIGVVGARQARRARARRGRRDERETRRRGEGET